MKLFENGVGRPSNEIKKKRKIFIVSAIVLCVALVSIFTFSLTKIDNNGLKGLSTKVSLNNTDFDVTALWGTGGSKKVNIKINSVGSQVGETAFVVCDNEADCINDNAWNLMNKVNKESTVKKTFKKNDQTTMQLKSGVASGANKTFYVRMTTYDNIIGDRLYWAVYKVKTASNPRTGETDKYDVGNKTLITSKMLVNSSVGGYDKAVLRSDYKVKYLWGEYGTKVMDIEITNVGSQVGETALVICEKKEDCMSSDAWNKMSELDELSTIKGRFKKGNDLIAMHLVTGSTNIANKKFYIRMTTYDKYDGNILYWSVHELKTASTPSSNPVGKLNVYNMNGSKSYISSKYLVPVKSDKTLKISCDSSKTVGSNVKCTVKDKNGAKVKDAKVTVVNSSIASVKNNGDGTYNVTFNDNLFSKYGSLKKYGKTLERYYIKSLISASKTGYTNAKTYSYIYERPFNLECPSSARVNEVFKCSTNKSGITLTVSAKNSLSSGYNSRFITKNSDRSINVKFSSTLFKKYASQIKKDDNGEYIKAAVNASKSGYSPITKYIKIYK